VGIAVGVVAVGGGVEIEIGDAGAVAAAVVAVLRELVIEVDCLPQPAEKSVVLVGKALF